MNVESSSVGVHGAETQPSTDQEIAVGDLIGLFARRWPLMLIVIVLVEALAGLYLWRTTPVYEAHALILAPSQGGGAGMEFQSLIIGRMLGSGDSLDTQAEVIKSPAVAGEAIEALDASLRGAIPEDIADALAARRYKSTDIIEVVVSGWRADAVAALANAVSERYLQYQEEKSKEEIRSVLDYVDSKIGEVHADLLNAQAGLRDFKETNRTVDLAAEAASVVTRVASMETEALKAEAMVAAAEAQLAAGRDRLVNVDGELVEQRDAVESAEVVDLKSRMASLQAQRVELLQEYTPASPEVAGVERQLEDVTGQLEAAATKAMAGVVAPLQAQVWAAEAQLQALRGASGPVRAEMASLPQKEYEYALLYAEVLVLGQAYQMLNEQYQKLRIREESQIGGTSILAAAQVPDHPVLPRKRATVALALVLALVVAIALALLVDHLDERVASEEEVLQLTGVPALAHLPRVSNGEEARLEHLAEHAPLLEAFQAFAGNVALSRRDDPPRVLAVCCSSGGEGNAMVAANAAVAFALGGKQTVLVDGDLRRPTQHERFGVSADVGLSSVATGAVELDAALQDTSVPGLKLLASGPPPPNPAEILSSERWRDALGKLREQADIIIVDTPPVGFFTDAQVSAAMADMAVVVVSMRDTTRGDLREAMRLLSLVKARIGGVVLNRVPVRSVATRYHGRQRH